MKVVLGLVIAAAVCACAGALPPPAPPRQTMMALNITTTTLPNGLRVVLVRDPSASDVQVTMRYDVGDSDDPPGQAGMAHLVEHLMFQQVLGGQSLFAKLEGVASYFNATTSRDATTYFSRAHRSRLEELLAVEAVRVGFRCTSITEPVFQRERAVVIEEMRLRLAIAGASRAIDSALFPSTATPGGDEASLASITFAQACAFADAHYATTNAVLVVSGNLTGPEVATALGKFLGRTAKRAATAHVAAKTLPASGRQKPVPAAVDKELVVVAWPMPEDLAIGAQLRAILGTVAASVDGEVKGAVVTIPPVEGRQRLLGFAVTREKGETTDDVIAAIERGVDAVPGAFAAQRGDIFFDRMKQSAIHEQFAALEVGEERDAALAAHVLAGRDASTAVADELKGLRALRLGTAVALARSHLTFGRAAIAVLAPDDAVTTGQKIDLAAPIHDLGQRRDRPDPAAAHQPLPPPAIRTGAIKTRRLANGLRVVMMPVTSVPTVEIRLVFGAGTADDPPARRGAALVAGHALDWNPRYLNDLLPFAAAGGTLDVEVGFDHTAFAVHGLDMYVDVLLAGLRRWVRDGRYVASEDFTGEAIRRQAKRSEVDGGALTDAWRTAVYGRGHPYIVAGRVRHVAPGLEVDDARAFKKAHFTPDNATLVIAGRFDALLADRWVDFLFADWTGTAAPRSEALAKGTVASIAKDVDGTRIAVSAAFPASAGTRAQRLVAAEMLAQIATDVRHQLAASYEMTAMLDESRLATVYLLSGTVDAPRADEVLELVRTRLATLASDPDAAARSFITARARVLTQLTGGRASARELAEGVEADAAFGREPPGDVAAAREVASLTIASMAPVLPELDLARAALILHGPRAEVDAAFAAIGRTAVRPAARSDDDDDDPLARARTRKVESESLYYSDLAGALTEQGPPSRWQLAVMPYAWELGKTLQGRITGWSIAAEVGYRLDTTTVLGVQASIGNLSGTYDSGRSILPDPVPIEVLPLCAHLFIQGNGFERMWGAVLVGVHYNRILDDERPAAWETSLGVGVQGGVDLLKRGRHRFGLYGRVESELLSDSSYAGLSLGVAYRR